MKWISVKDDLPQHNRMVLTHQMSDIGLVAYAFLDGSDHVWKYQNMLGWSPIKEVNGNDVTHWMPLPDPPALPESPEEYTDEK